MRARNYLLVGFVLIGQFVLAQGSFVQCSKGRFFINNRPYYFIGANYWYGGLLPNDPKGKERVVKELDFLLSKGVTNLRVLAGSEGTGKENGVNRVAPALQPGKGIFDSGLLKGLDFLLSEMNKRNMKAVIFLSNNWEWSGGFLQYLNWNGQLSDSIMRRKLNWNEMRDYVSKFYSCAACDEEYLQQVKMVVSRINTITKKKYDSDPAIMAWELANEPRPMRPQAIPAYIKWVSNTAAFIRSLDPNHLITVGSEGEMGSENIDVFEKIHADKNIDYATIHIWPKNWSWFKDTAIAASFNGIVINTNTYIDKHLAVVKKLGKPLVLEEFGLPRDKHSYAVGSSTSLRDQYYAVVFDNVLKSVQRRGNVAGSNFWSFSGSGRPAGKTLFWKKGDDVLGDPPQEEQGLNSVFDNDNSTWNVIESFSKRIKALNDQAYNK